MSYIKNSATLLSLGEIGNNGGIFYVGVKFCGNCNPVIDGKKLLEEIAQSLPEYKFITPNKEVSALLIISGCESDCATRPDWPVKTIQVSGLTVDLISYPEKDLSIIVIKKLLNLREG
ncbi:hypothetical protein [Desulfotomaculum copahuensis]|uniref:hypothetical protein n=1 Tax=Desulfotomaculum copahuensis TaxID=1838280 RepID=UPI000A8F32C7|nr:hypothetical protein [Desulfotomaculum copahuensis]